MTESAEIRSAIELDSRGAIRPSQSVDLYMPLTWNEIASMAADDDDESEGGDTRPLFEGESHNLFGLTPEIMGILQAADRLERIRLERAQAQRAAVRAAEQIRIAELKAMEQRGHIERREVRNKIQAAAVQAYRASLAASRGGITQLFTARGSDLSLQQRVAHRAALADQDARESARREAGQRAPHAAAQKKLGATKNADLISKLAGYTATKDLPDKEARAADARTREAAINKPRANFPKELSQRIEHAARKQTPQLSTNREVQLFAGDIIKEVNKYPDSSSRMRALFEALQENLSTLEKARGSAGQEIANELVGHLLATMNTQGDVSLVKLCLEFLGGTHGSPTGYRRVFALTEVRSRQVPNFGTSERKKEPPKPTLVPQRAKDTTFEPNIFSIRLAHRYLSSAQGPQLLLNISEFLGKPGQENLDAVQLQQSSQEAQENFAYSFSQALNRFTPLDVLTQRALRKGLLAVVQNPRDASTRSAFKAMLVPVTRQILIASKQQRAQRELARQQEIDDTVPIEVPGGEGVFGATSFQKEALTQEPSQRVREADIRRLTFGPRRSVPNPAVSDPFEETLAQAERLSGGLEVAPPSSDPERIADQHARVDREELVARITDEEIAESGWDLTQLAGQNPLRTAPAVDAERARENDDALRYFEVQHKNSFGSNRASKSPIPLDTVAQRIVSDEENEAILDYISNSQDGSALADLGTGGRLSHNNEERWSDGLTAEMPTESFVRARTQRGADAFLRIGDAPVRAEEKSSNELLQATARQYLELVLPQVQAERKLSDQIIALRDASGAMLENARLQGRMGAYRIFCQLFANTVKPHYAELVLAVFDEDTAALTSELSHTIVNATDSLFAADDKKPDAAIIQRERGPKGATSPRMTTGEYHLRHGEVSGGVVQVTDAGAGADLTPVDDYGLGINFGMPAAEVLEDIFPAGMQFGQRRRADESPATVDFEALARAFNPELSFPLPLFGEVPVDGPQASPYVPSYSFVGRDLLDGGREILGDTEGPTPPQVNASAGMAATVESIRSEETAPERTPALARAPSAQETPRSLRTKILGLILVLLGSAVAQQITSNNGDAGNTESRPTASAAPTPTAQGIPKAQQVDGPHSPDYDSDFEPDLRGEKPAVVITFEEMQKPGYVAPAQQPVQRDFNPPVESHIGDPDAPAVVKDMERKLGLRDNVAKPAPIKTGGVMKAFKGFASRVGGFFSGNKVAA